MVEEKRFLFLRVTLKLLQAGLFAGYFRNNYYNNNQSNEEENTIVTVETENEKLEIPEELTMEFLHELSRRLDDPNTHQDASEMIERLYEMFIVDESYENNNR